MTNFTPRNIARENHQDYVLGLVARLQLASKSMTFNVREVGSYDGKYISRITMSENPATAFALEVTGFDVVLRDSKDEPVTLPLGSYLVKYVLEHAISVQKVMNRAEARVEALSKVDHGYRRSLLNA